MEIINKRLTEIKPYEHNPRKNDDAVEFVANSIRDFGFKVPIIIDKDGVIVAGHTRFKAAKKLGLTEVPCIMADDLNEEQIKAFRLADNKTAEKAEWDLELLALELDGLGDLSEYGFDVPEEYQEEEPNPDEDGIDEETVESRAKRGDLWLLGNHRLLVGDSTNAADVERLMAGEEADLMTTDPPYNVALGVNETPEEMKRRKRRTDGLTVANDAMSDDDFEEFLVSAFRNASEHMRPGAAYYCWYASAAQKVAQIALERAGFPPRQILVWVKSIFVFGRQDYQWRHEPCFYGWKGGAAHYFIDDRTLSTVDDDLDLLTREEAIERIREMSRLTTATYEPKPSRSKEHPTMKPVNLIKNQINNSSREGELVIDPFGGSGTTLLACELLNRRRNMMEIDPHYADVIITRWEEMTGREAKLADE